MMELTFPLASVLTNTVSSLPASLDPTPATLLTTSVRISSSDDVKTFVTVLASDTPKGKLHEQKLMAINVLHNITASAFFLFMTMPPYIPFFSFPKIQLMYGI